MASATFSPGVGTDDGYVWDPAGYNNNQNAIATAAAGLFRCWVRFPNVSIPQGSTIVSATLGISCQTSNAVDEVCAVFCNDVNDATYPKTRAAFDAKVLTSASYRWAKGGAWAMNAHYSSGNMGSVLQEVINRSGFVSGNAVMVIMKHASLAGTKNIYSHDSVGKHVTLSVVYSPPVTGGSGNLVQKLVTIIRR